MDYLTNVERKRELLTCIAANIPGDAIESEKFNEIVMDLTYLALGVIRPEPAAASPEKQDEPKKRGKKSTIDLGKLKALHNAGWSNAKIADEMKITAPTVAYHLKKMAEEANEEGNNKSNDQGAGTDPVHEDN